MARGFSPAQRPSLAGRPAAVRTRVLISKACRGTIPPLGKIKAGIKNSLPMPAPCDGLQNLDSGEF